MATGTTAQQTVDVVTPAAGESVTEGTILEWHTKVGEQIEVDDTIVEISTDKVDVELPSPASGTVTEILVEEGDTVTVGQVIARIAVGDGAQASGAGEANATNGGAQKGAEPSTDAPANGQASDGDGQALDGMKVSPVAARAAAVEGVNLATVSGSGPSGRIVKADVLGATPDGPSAAPAAAGAQPIKGAAAVLARYMDESRSIPTATSFRTLTVTVLEGRRRELKESGRKVSFTHLIAYAIARAGEDMEVMGNHFAELDGKPQRVKDGQVNLGLAVDVEKKDGTRTLMVPVIRDAGRMPFERFVAAYDALVEKARTNTLTA